MTVQGLIDKLQLVEDKDLPVYTAYGEHGGPVYFVVQSKYIDNRILLATDPSDIYPDKLIESY